VRPPPWAANDVVIVSSFPNRFRDTSRPYLTSCTPSFYKSSDSASFPCGKHVIHEVPRTVSARLITTLQVCCYFAR
jgi:hypothetical protein